MRHAWRCASSRRCSPGLSGTGSATPCRPAKPNSPPPVWIGGVALAALLLPVEPTADTESVFEIAEALRDVEFRVIAYPGVDLLVDYVDLTPVLLRPERPRPEVVVDSRAGS